MALPKGSPTWGEDSTLKRTCNGFLQRVIGCLSIFVFCGRELLGIGIVRFVSVVCVSM